MYSCPQRLLEILTVSVTVGLAGVLLVVVSSLVPFGHTQSQPVVTAFNVSTSPLMRMRMPVLYAQEVSPPPLQDYVFFRFTLRADFSPLWDWNTKAVYVACVARYSTDQYVVNEVTLLDTLLKSRTAAAEWQLDNAEKYPLEDARLGALAGVQVQLSIRYQVLRYCGYSPTFEISPVGNVFPVFTLPRTYASSLQDGHVAHTT
ncbi:peptide hydrolase [Trypanosoma rangeli]|uniref:Signal peptidase complex subunit 3 n=1 Tax=Trypanosoma rangeli TaxID=5698 RepID=A0A3R7MI84_TRYRA|nr:peptide hydrolase [Trypanosoma rangeli]RNF06371.1 peptide hydrolase [Trypanosoma rangeli]|eukprot:RNF06371.1 peptide hydrolase [Trypanosoma rangeli]